MLGLALLLAFVVFQGAAQAATFNVDSTGDGSDTNLADGVCNDGTGKCTLRAAIEQAASGDTVSIPSGTYTLGATFTIIINLTLSGAGSGDTIIQASTVNPVETPGAPGVANFRLFSIGTNNVTISGVTIRHGNPPSVGGGIATSAGATVTLTNSTVSGNSGTLGGGIANHPFTTLILNNTTVSGNVAGTGAGGGISNVDGTLTLTGSTVSGNTASTHGGGIFNEFGTVTLTTSTVSGNTAGQNGGGIFNGSSGTLTMTNSTSRWQHC